MITKTTMNNRFTMRLINHGFSDSSRIYTNVFQEAADGLELFDPIDHKFLVKEAVTSRARELEAAIIRFRECGVSLDRMTIQEWPGESVLCIDGDRRFSWRLVTYYMPEQQDDIIRTYDPTIPVVNRMQR